MSGLLRYYCCLLRPLTQTHLVPHAMQQEEETLEEVLVMYSVTSSLHHRLKSLNFWVSQKEKVQMVTALAGRCAT